MYICMAEVDYISIDKYIILPHLIHQYSNMVPRLSGQTLIGPLQDPVTWYRINYTGTQVTQWDFENKGSHTSLYDFPLFWKSHCVTCVPV